MSRPAILPIAVLVAGLLAGLPARAQETATAGTTDRQGWASVALKYKFDKQWTASAEEQLRLKNDLAETDMFFSQFGVQFETRRGVSLDTGLRLIRRNDTQGKRQGFESQRRYHFSAAYRHKPGRLVLDYRVRYQTREDLGGSATNTDRHLRFRARVRYNFRDWQLDPAFTVELYRALGSGGESGFDRLRYTMGTDWDAWGRSVIGVFYRLEKELGVDDPATTHIVGFSFTYVLGRD